MLFRTSFYLLSTTCGASSSNRDSFIGSNPGLKRQLSECNLNISKNLGLDLLKIRIKLDIRGGKCIRRNLPEAENGSLKWQTQ